ncbi:TPR-like protein [Linderina pennispora]|uniref:TPR-like protein n=1 Tax=Linderina pennispora TaxID=61395 RepID=A0A1Y1W4F2_9FUNG|nr:TPR-like protein [Linderina pennispora]ORX68401.1 TPR-like protein [Linderina pennispora]
MKCGLLAGTATLLLLTLTGSASGELTTTQEYLEEANNLLLHGKYREAISHYDAAIAKDPQNYLTYFKRATTYLTINKHSSALKDFSRAIEIKPDFDQAYLQRAKVYLREGDLDGADSDIAKVTTGNAKIFEKSKELKDKIALARDMANVSSKALAEKKYSECIDSASKVIRVSPLHTSILKTRAACRMASGDLEGASADLGRLVRIHPGDLKTQAKLADLHYLALNESERGMEHVRGCLKSDPDNKMCQTVFKRLRALGRKVEKLESDKAKGKWNACNRGVAPANGKPGLLDDVDQMYAQFVIDAEIPATVPAKLATYLAGIACEGYTHTKKWDHAMKHCDRVLEAEPGNADALGNKFEALLETDEVDQAQVVFASLEQANGGGPDHQRRMHERRMRLEQKKRMAARKDYYKILDVPRDASQRDIKKAFRKLAHQWHPDRYRGDLPKDKVEEKMAEINMAYEVLSDEETRTRYDQGEDPNDPTGGHGGPGGFGGANPFMFQHGGPGGGKPMFFQQGGSGQHFAFNFGGPGGGFPF